MDDKKTLKKEEIEIKYSVPIPDFINNHTESRKQQIIILAIWIRFVHFKRFAPENRKKHILGDFFKLSNLLKDPSDLVFIPYHQSKKLPYGVSVSRIHLAILDFPNIASIRLDLFFKDFFTLYQETYNKNPEICTKLVALFLRKLWISNFFESNSDQDLMIEAFEEAFQDEKLKASINEFKTETELINYFLSNISSLKEINKLISIKVHEVNKNPRVLRKTFKSVHNEIKDIFEVFSYFIGLVRAFTDILANTIEPSISNYFDKRNHVCYGIINFGMGKLISKLNAEPIKMRLEEQYPTLVSFLEKIFFNELRLIRNSESHLKMTTQQDKIDEKIYIIENNMYNFRKEYNLGDFWVLKSNFYQLLTLIFNLFFYLLPDNQIHNYLNSILSFKKFDIGFNYPDLNLTPLIKEIKEEKN